MDLPGGQGDQDDKYIASQASLVHSAAALDDPDFMYGCKKNMHVYVCKACVRVIASSRINKLCCFRYSLCSSWSIYKYTFYMNHAV